MQGQERRRLVEAMVWAMDQDLVRLRRALDRLETVARAGAALDAGARSAVVEAHQAARTEAVQEAEMAARRVLLYAEYVAERVGHSLLE